MAQISQSNLSAASSPNGGPKIRRGYVDFVNLYEVKEDELELIERGSPVDLYLNFGIAFVSIACSALGNFIVTEKFKFEHAPTVLIVMIVVGFALGAILIGLWWRSRKEISGIIDKIRKRIPPEELLSSNPRLIEFFRRIKKFEEKMPFIGVKFLAEKIFQNEPESRGLLQYAIDQGCLLTFQVANPKNPNRATLACKLNRENKITMKALELLPPDD